MEMNSKYPNVIISEAGEPFLDKGQMWMYRNNLIKADDACRDGEIVRIVTSDNRCMGTGFYSAVSHIAVRILTKNDEQQISREFFAQRICAAWQFRKTVNQDNLSNMRLIFGEADLLPGLTVDRYNDILVSQISCAGMEHRKDMIYGLLLDILKEDGQDVRGIYERNDIKVRDKEGLEQYKGFYQNAKLSSDQAINENGVLLNVDIAEGQKTGYFLDQKSNRVLLRNISRGKNVLDCFTHTGGFALNAAYGGASRVTAVDVSGSALAEGRKNAELNHLQDRIDFVQADVFEYLDRCSEGQFDIIVLDPPAFTKSRSTVSHAYHGYQEINMKAMNLLRQGGYLVTCSCSRFMEIDLFEQMLRESAQKTGTVLKQVSVTQQNSDHPILWNMEETAYLKFYIFQVISQY